MSNNQNFGRVLISSIYKRDTRVSVKTEAEYMEQYKARNRNQGGLCEIVGLDEYQVKPYFDVDGKDKDDEPFNEEVINDICKDIQKIDNNDIYIGNRPKREENGVMKYSYRLYLKARISYKNIPVLFKEVFDKYDIIDKSVYNPNRILFAPLSDRKKDLQVPVLTNIKGSIFDCCATYIDEDYKDLDMLIVKDIDPKNRLPVDDLLTKINKMLYDDETSTYDCKLNFIEIMTKLSKERASIYNGWFYIGVSLINLFHRKIITRGQIYDLFDLFSSKADNYNADSVCKTIDIHISRFDGKGYGIKYLLECLKVDDYEYYKQITKKDMMIDSANDDVGASEIVINHYREQLVICKGILFINDNDIWISNEKQVDKLLIDMIGKLDIKFYGADGKRKYSYNTSIKHIKDCSIVIKANKTIVDDKFYENMIKNNKYYLPFNDGLYSFKDKILYTYQDLPNIHFTYKINRNFPKFNKTDYEDLMQKVIIPIYPNEEERQYNAHIKARALAGCYEDKKWYGYSGSRNSGKGTETGIMRNAFGDFVLEFNAKCLIFNKFGNQEPAKALSWVVDKKDARIIISNEIDGDDDTKLNGAFIKTLASGGDAMEGRKLYENTISFKPQFTMILCYNRFYDVVPADAKENLEQFEYKSKFVCKDELIDGVSFLKLKDDTIKDFIGEDRIIDAYTLYILNAFTNPRMNTPQIIKNSTEINNGEVEMTVEQFIITNFKNSNEGKDRLHTDTVNDILNDKGYKITNTEINKLLNRIGIGKYNKMCNVDKVRKTGYDFIKYLGITYD
jgi:hypothetical protein